MFAKYKDEDEWRNENSDKHSDIVKINNELLNLEPQSYRTYKRRYYMLALYGANTGFNALAWISIAPINSTFKEAYKLTSFEVNLVAQLYLIAFLPSMLISTYIFDKFDLRNGLVIGALFQGIGAALKYFVNYEIWLLFLGQAFLGIAQPFFLDSPSMVATYWFEDSSREIAITGGTTFNTIGIALGFILPTLFVDSNIEDMNKARSQIQLSLLVQGFIGVALMFLIIFTFQNKPPMAPSANAVVEREDALCRSYGKLVLNFEFLKLCVCFSLYFSNILVLSTILDSVVEIYGFNTDDSGLFGTLNVIAGFFGGFIYGFILKKFHCYKTLNVAIGVTSIVALLGFYFALETKKYWLVMLTYILFGAANFPCLNISFAYGSEITFPIKEVTAGGLFILGSQPFGFGLTTLGSELLDDLGRNILFILIGTTFIGTLGAMIMKPVDINHNDEIRANSQSKYRDSFKSSGTVDLQDANWVKYK